METRLHVTGTRVAEYFRFACERQLRYELVPEAERGADVPRPGFDSERGVRIGPRPGTGLLAAAGRRWERQKVRQLIRRFGAERVVVEGRTPAGYARRIPAERVVELLRDPGRVEVLVQPELCLPDPAAFARRFGIDPAKADFGPGVPDLIRIRRLRDGSVRFQVIDIKSTAEGRIPHFAQVAFYTLLLEEVCRAAEIAGRVDRRWGRVWARDGRGPQRFALAAYRHHVVEMLHRDVARVTELAPAEAAWHLSRRCTGCAYLEHCRDEADRGDDLARVNGITPTAKRVLHGRGVRTVRDLARSMRRDTYLGCHALESQPERLRQRAQAVQFGKVFDVDVRTHLMPAFEDVRLVLSAEGDPVTGVCFALGLRLHAEVTLEGAPELGVWIAEGGSAVAERAILDSFLRAVERVLGAVAARGRPTSVHFYVYDRAELEQLRALLLRYLGDAEARPAIARLLRFLSPRSVAAQPDVLRTTPGTIVSEVVSALFALPVPYAYDLAAVSERLAPSREGWRFAVPAEYAAPFTSQVAFERAHDLWRGESPEEAREGIQRAIVSKLRAVDSVIRAVRERAARKQRLQMRKEPLALDADAGTLRDPMLEALRVAVELESAAEAVETRALHVLPAEERARRFECIRGLELRERRDDGSLVFAFDPACRDAKFRAGDFNLVLTHDDDRTLLDTDRQPWKRRRLMVELREYDLACDPPRVVLAPGSGFAKAEAEGWIHLDRVCVLDRAPGDFGTRRLLGTLAALDAGAGAAPAVLELLRGTAAEGPADPAEGPLPTDLLAPARLNADQERAWRAALERPLSVIWGPPGTGKTYLLAWILIGLAARARRAGRPLRVLVCASTHRAIATVLAKLAAEGSRAGPGVPLRAVKLRGSGSDADSELVSAGVEVLPDTGLPGLLDEAERDATPLVVGSTVWSLWKQMRAAAAADAPEGVEPHPVQPWFDVVVIDEASQMKVAESLIALSAARPGARVVCCGDDKQLAPVSRTSLASEAGTLFGSVFSHLAAHHPRLALRESRRMNRALVAYPRRTFYPGLVSAVPERRLAVRAADPEEPDAPLAELFFRPDDAIVLCTYRGVRATARNPFEAKLAARLTALARRLLVDPEGGAPLSAARFVAEGVAVLSPHRAQNAAILAEMRGLGLAPDETPVVDTVERMQGNERELIVVSYGVADREYAEAEAEFLLDPNRFNVAVTRARCKLVLLVSEEVLDALPADDRVMAGSMALKGYRGHCSHGTREARFPGPDGEIVTVRLHTRSLAPEPPPPPSTPHGDGVTISASVPAR